jgi:hypothetical protein
VRNRDREIRRGEDSSHIRQSLSRQGMQEFDQQISRISGISLFLFGERDRGTGGERGRDREIQRKRERLRDTSEEIVL